MKYSVLIFFASFLIACQSRNKGSNKNDVIHSMFKVNDSELQLPDTKDVLVVRTDYTNDMRWNKVRHLIRFPTNPGGYKAFVEFLEDDHCSEVKANWFLDKNEKYEHLFIFLVDSLTIYNREHPLLCVDLYEKPGQSFRVVASALWEVENNLTIANTDWEELQFSLDEDGVYRGVVWPLK